MKYFAPILVAGLLLASCSQKATTVGQISQLDQPEVVPGEYIVTLKKDAVGDLTAQSASNLITTLGLEASGITVQHMYSQLLTGFAGKVSEQNLQKLKNDPRVEAIEPNGVVYTTAEPMLSAQAVQRGAIWGLDRIDQRSLPLSGTYDYPDGGGRGVSVYVLDTGVNIYHREFGNRARWGANFTGDGKNYDCLGHGTHVAGTIGGTTFGVAKNVNIVAVKVLNCEGSGSNANIIRSLEWVAKQSGLKVVNMSLGPKRRSVSSAFDSAVNAAVSRGVAVVAAAGNSSDDACFYSPARASSAITVIATTDRDARASFSNYGSCTDVGAPGQSIRAAWHTSNSATNTISGTSMAAPHVAGVAALKMAAGTSAAAMEAEILREATTGKLTGLRGSPDRLVYMGALR